MGVLLLVVLVALAAAIGVAIERVAGRGWGAVLVVIAGTTGLAQRSLHDHVAAVYRPLARGDLEGARGAVAMIVGRDTEGLDENGIATAAIESLAESFATASSRPLSGSWLPACRGYSRRRRSTPRTAWSATAPIASPPLAGRARVPMTGSTGYPRGSRACCCASWAVADGRSCCAMRRSMPRQTAAGLRRRWPARWAGGWVVG